MSRSYIKKEVAEILGVERHTIQYYTDRGLINPDVHAPKGRGKWRRYSKYNIFEAALLRRLNEARVTLEDGKFVLGRLRAGCANESLMNLCYWKSPWMLVLHGHGVGLVAEITMSRQLHMRGVSCLVIKLGGLKF